MRDVYFGVDLNGQYRFKSFEEFQITTGKRLEVPRRYVNIFSLDDLKIQFVEKKRFD